MIGPCRSRTLEGQLLLLAPLEASPQPLLAALAAAGATVTSVSSVAAAEGALAHADALLVLPGVAPSSLGDGWLLWVQQVARFRSEQTVVVFDDALGAEDRRSLIDAGVSGIYPGSTPEVAMAMLRATFRRRRSQASEPLDLQLDARAQVASNAFASVRLSEREFALLTFLLQHRGRVQSREALLEGVWGDLFGVEERTVDTTLSRLRARLKRELGLNDAIRTLPPLGYLIDAAAPLDRSWWTAAGVWLCGATTPEERELVRLAEVNGLRWRTVRNGLATPAGVGLVLAGEGDGWLATLTDLLSRWPAATVMLVDAGADERALATAIDLGVCWVVPHRWADVDLGRWLATPHHEEVAPATPAALELLPEAFAARVRGVHVPLPRRDYEVLEFLHRYAGRPVRREQLRQAVWGSGTRSAARSLDAAIGNLRRAIGGGVREPPPTIETVVGVGYRLLLG